MIRDISARYVEKTSVMFMSVLHPDSLVSCAWETEVFRNIANTWILGYYFNWLHQQMHRSITYQKSFSWLVSDRGFLSA